MVGKVKIFASLWGLLVPPPLIRGENLGIEFFNPTL
ncbi:uncharacterized protein G2W53_022623 [Senna tora]|uniref:Uncharacterized protein n=1 Tax=Senna tora TaxID=362788 RepID=A0A834WPA8_9FABA|nr:uncharacterized protein G2W53_022623 [Senna tora]